MDDAEVMVVSKRGPIILSLAGLGVADGEGDEVRGIVIAMKLFIEANVFCYLIHVDNSGNWVINVLDLINMLRVVSEQGLWGFLKVRMSVIVSHAGLWVDNDSEAMRVSIA